MSSRFISNGIPFCRLPKASLLHGDSNNNSGRSLDFGNSVEDWLMKDERRTISLGFSDQRFPEGQHICYIYSDDDERLDVMAKFLESGRSAKEKLLYLVDVMTSQEMLAHLKDLGVDFSGAKPGDFTISDATPAYCPTGFFKTEEMLDLVRDFYLNALDEGYAGARGTGEMSWCLAEGLAKKEDLMDYEARLNDLLGKYPHTAC